MRSLNLKDKLNIIDGINVMVPSHKPTLILEFIWIKTNLNKYLRFLRLFNKVYEELSYSNSSKIYCLYFFLKSNPKITFLNKYKYLKNKKDNFCIFFFNVCHRNFYNMSSWDI